MDLINNIKATSEAKPIITYVHQYEKDFYYKVFGDSVQYLQLPYKVELKDNSTSTFKRGDENNNGDYYT